MISATGFSIVMPFLSIFLYTQMGVPMTVVGMVFLGTAVAGAVGQIMGGEMADRLGRRPVMWVSMAFRGVIFLLLSIAIANFADLIIVAALLMVSSSMGSLFEPASNAMVADLVETERAARGVQSTKGGPERQLDLGPLIEHTGNILLCIALRGDGAHQPCGSIHNIQDKGRRSPSSAAPPDRFHLEDPSQTWENRVFFAVLPGILSSIHRIRAAVSQAFALFSEDVVGISWWSSDSMRSMESWWHSAVPHGQVL